MSKMLWELNAPLVMAKVKEDFSLNNLYKYIRYYRMYLERFALYHNKENITRAVEDKLFWRGKVALCFDKLMDKLIACVIDNEYLDPNGNITKVDVSAENGYKRKGLKVGEDVVILYADETHVAPVIYIWAIATEIIEREDIINTQDNMLRKPILVDGVGEDLDNAVVKASNVLSGVAWLNRKGKKSKENIMDSKELEVLNLQLGNAYKGAELWDSRKHFEEFICDYLGYGTTKNEKRERMNTDEVNLENSIGQTFYKSAVRLHEKAVEEVKSILGQKLEFIKNLENEKEEVKEDGSAKTNVERTPNE